MKFREFKLRRDPECPVCGEHPIYYATEDYEFFCGNVLAASEAMHRNAVPEISVQELKRRLEANGTADCSSMCASHIEYESRESKARTDSARRTA